MDLIIRGSEYTDFLTCRKKWYYGWVEKITPIRQNNKLFIGTAFHKWLENYYNSECSKLSADLLTSTWMNEKDTSGMEQTELDDMMKLLRGMATHYDNIYYDTDKQWKVLATELEFIVKLEDDIFYTGTIDLVYEVDGKIRFADHKTVASISQYEEKSQMDRQISRYWWALKAIADGIGRVKNADGLWVPFLELQGKEIDGFDYNLINKDYPREPKVLKSGKLSTDKSQKTTYTKYINKLHDMGISAFPSEYEEILKHLSSKPDPFLKRVNVLRNDVELEAAMWEFMYTAGDIHDVRLLAENPHNTEQVTYRNIGDHCQHMCGFKALCQTAIEGGNVALTRNLAYKKNTDR